MPPTRNDDGPAGENLYDVLRSVPGGDDRTFLEPLGGPAVSYDDAFARAASMAGALRDHGVTAGESVVVQVPKCVDAVALYLGCLQLGAVYVPLNPAFTQTEMAFYLRDAEPAVVVAGVDRDHAGSGVATLTLGPRGQGTLIDAAAVAEPVNDVAGGRGDDVAAMLYTSGTTGRPKGAMLTHRGLLANGRALTETWGFRSDDVLVHGLPIFHVHGLFVALHCTMLARARAVFLERFDAAAVVAALPDATVFMGVPTHYVRLLDDDGFDVGTARNMRLFTSGSAPMTERIHGLVAERTGHRVLERYGMTEAGIITSNPLDGERIAGSVGYPLPGVELRVATDDGPCAAGETGVVEVRGPHMFAGYWRLDDATAAAHRADGFFVTGDVGHVDDSGRLWLQGRAGDMIISGGENIHPKEIERAVDDAPGVVESAVIGVPDHDLGETVVAYVVPAEDYDEDTVRRSVAATLAGFKRPKQYRPLPALPRNAMGKVQKAALRDLDGVDTP